MYKDHLKIILMTIVLVIVNPGLVVALEQRPSHSQDSVFTCLYHERLFWMWGDAGRPSYPLGHFAMAGAVSPLPSQGGLDPAIGVNLEYYVDKDGFSRPLCRLKEPGLVWLDGLITVKDNKGRERMVAKIARLCSGGVKLLSGRRFLVCQYSF